MLADFLSSFTFILHGGNVELWMNEDYNLSSELWLKQKVKTAFLDGIPDCRYFVQTGSTNAP